MENEKVGRIEGKFLWFPRWRKLSPEAKEALSLSLKKGIADMNYDLTKKMLEDRPASQKEIKMPEEKKPVSGLELGIRHALMMAATKNGSNTPDAILAEYLLACLNAFHLAVIQREEFYNRTMDDVEEGE